MMPSPLEQLLQLSSPQMAFSLQQQYRSPTPNLPKFRQQSMQAAQAVGPLSLESKVGDVAEHLHSLIHPEISLTKGENQYFKNIFKNSADWMDLVESVPSARWSEGKLKIHPKDLDRLDNYIEETYRWREGEKLPPSFYSGGITKRFLKDAK